VQIGVLETKSEDRPKDHNPLRTVERPLIKKSLKKLIIVQTLSLFISLRIIINYSKSNYGLL